MKLPEEIQFIANAHMVQKATDARMDGRLCIITGATSGVGYRAARRLAPGRGKPCPGMQEQGKDC
jgi:retinol dehydrogenase 13